MNAPVKLARRIVPNSAQSQEELTPETQARVFAGGINITNPGGPLPPQPTKT